MTTINMIDRQLIELRKPVVVIENVGNGRTVRVKAIEPPRYCQDHRHWIVYGHRWIKSSRTWSRMPREWYGKTMRDD